MVQVQHSTAQHTAGRAHPTDWTADWAALILTQQQQCTYCLIVRWCMRQKLVSLLPQPLSLMLLRQLGVAAVACCMCSNHALLPHPCLQLEPGRLTFCLIYMQVQSNTENIRPQLAKLPPILGASRRMVCSKSQSILHRKITSLRLDGYGGGLAAAALVQA